MALLKPEGLIHGHYECRSLDDTLPLFTDLLACEVLQRSGAMAAVRHPNTDWTLVMHEAGLAAPDKPRANHYGFRVANHKEIEAAWKYIDSRLEQYRITSLSNPQGGHFAYSIYIQESGGNTIEIEYYNTNAAKHGRKVAAGHWSSPLTEEHFPGRGYIPQALSHGTAECDNKELSNSFYTEILGLDIVGGGNVSTYIGHSDTPWYIVVLPALKRNYLRPVNRYTIKLSTRSEVSSAYNHIRKLSTGVTALGELHEINGDIWFALSDLDHNWWEITSTEEPNPSPDA